MKTVEYKKSDISGFFEQRPRNSNKSDYGRFLVVGGSCGMTGALKLCVDSCYRAGAGIVLYTAKKDFLLEYDLLTTEGIAVPVEDISEHIQNKHCICIGCGLVPDKENTELLVYILKNADCPVVCDAGALRILADNLSMLEQYGHKMIILPHPGEMSALNGMTIENIQKDRINTAYSFYEKYGCITVLKGHETVVAGEKGIYVNRTGNPGMATAGSGDVLAGMTCAYTKLSDDMFTNTCVSVYMHGYAGDIAMQKYGMISMRASDISSSIYIAHKEVLGGKA